MYINIFFAYKPSVGCKGKKQKTGVGANKKGAWWRAQLLMKEWENLNAPKGHAIMAFRCFHTTKHK
jgi:hypothetical protein